MKLSISSLFFFFMISCLPSKKDLSDINPLIFQEKHLCWSDIANDITYIPLDNSSYINNITDIEFTDSLIFISSTSKKGGGIYSYNWQGGLVDKLEDINGNGPGECNYNNDFAIDKSKNRIYVVDAKQEEIEVYSMKDKYVKTISLKNKVTGFPTDIAIWNSILILGYSGSDEYNWAIIDTFGNLVNKKKNALYPYKCNVGLLGGFYKYGNKINFWDPFNDTIFSISHNLAYQAEYSFIRGEEWSPPMIEDISKFHTLFKIHNILETYTYIYIFCSYKENMEVFLYDKKAEKNYLLSENGISNTIDGGVSMKKFITYYEKDNKKYLVKIDYPYRIKAHVASKHFKNSIPKYPEKKKELEKLADSLDENDNPVLMLVKLKE